MIMLMPPLVVSIFIPGQPEQLFRQRIKKSADWMARPMEVADIREAICGLLPSYAGSNRSLLMN
jgi:hypothetical protein